MRGSGPDEKNLVRSDGEDTTGSRNGHSDTVDLEMASSTEWKNISGEFF